MTYADPPRLAAPLRADHADVAAEIDEPTGRSHLAAELGGTVAGIFLAETAEIQLEALLRKGQAAIAQGDLVQADQRQQRRDGARLRQAALGKIPGTPEHARGDVERARAGAMAALGEGDQAGGLSIDVDRIADGRALIDPGQLAVRAVARIAGFDPTDFRLRGERDRSSPRISLDVNGAGGCHRLKSVHHRGHRLA
jgi:hypothetical protein